MMRCLSSLRVRAKPRHLPYIYIYDIHDIHDIYIYDYMIYISYNHIYIHISCISWTIMRIKLMSDEIELSCRRRDVDSLKTWVAEGVASACHKMVDTRNAVLKLFGLRRSPGEAQWLLLNWELVDWLRSPGSSICNWEDFWHCWHCWLVHALLIGSSYCLTAKCRYQVLRFDHCQQLFSVPEPLRAAKGIPWLGREKTTILQHFLIQS